MKCLTELLRLPWREKVGDGVLHQHQPQHLSIIMTTTIYTINMVITLESGERGQQKSCADQDDDRVKAASRRGADVAYLKY